MDAHGRVGGETHIEAGIEAREGRYEQRGSPSVSCICSRKLIKLMGRSQEENFPEQNWPGV